MSVKKTYNRKFFKKWSCNMAYILGFIFADGNLVKSKRGNHYMTIYSADLYLLKSMAAVMESNHKISGRRKVNRTGIVYRIQIGSMEIFKDLVRIGLVPNKVCRMRLPINTPDIYISDFIRGYFDGDGCVWSGMTHKQRKIHTMALQVYFTSASHEFLCDLLFVLKKLGISGGSLFRAKTGNYSRLVLSTLDSLKIYKIMYNSRHKLFLPRKKLIFDKFIKMRP